VNYLTPWGTTNYPACELNANICALLNRALNTSGDSFRRGPSNQRCQEISLRRAAYGEDSGIAGAAALWHQPDRKPIS